jgi:hypothetical protein
MTRLGQVGWRAAVMIAAFAATAALAVTLTRAPARSASAPPGSAGCPTSVLRASVGQAGPASTGTSAAGGLYYMLDFTNVSDQVCSLYGYPAVSAYVTSQRGAGQPGEPSPAGALGGAAVHDPVIRPRSVRLAPGQTAQSVLRITGTGRLGPKTCRRDLAEELRVTLPDQGRSAFVPVRIPVCSPRQHLSLSIQALQARSGVSGYTMP